MKSNSIKSGGNKNLLMALGAICAVVTFCVGVYGVIRLKAIYEEQCVITDMAAQVVITSGKMVKPDIIAENLGLRKGVNLAHIDLVRKREDILKKIPTLKSLSITRIPPGSVRIVAEEREPVARMGIRGVRRVTGRVVDLDGMVFLCQRGTYHLPTISEPRAPGTRVGSRIAGRASAALALIEACQSPEFQELGVQDIDISRPDYLFVTLGDYSRLKIAWEGMDAEPTEKSRAVLRRRLEQLLRTVRSRVGTGTKIWNATIENKIFADTQGEGS